MQEPVVKNHNTGKFQYLYGARASRGYDTKREAARAYIKELVQKEPKYKPLFEDKNWEQIYKMVGINL